ncbi:hypothetical protein [Cellulophaga baltica]|uniref:hypothetical protein n=1 Tax=Cellulophaga baltica TaxID=76594 RepID=UPI002493DC69|nr:hypothetical protein [Cellulophaga baltica]
MKRLFILELFTTFFTIVGYSQPKNIPLAEVTSENVVDYIASKVKVYDKNPVYAIRPLQNSCVYEILVNGYLLHKNYDLQKLGTPIPINAAILKSGTQTITYRLYPLEDLMVDTYGKGDTVHTLLKNTSMNIEVIKYEDVKTGTRIGDEILVTKHESSTKKGTREFIGSGLPYYEYTFTFNATVPYNNEGWSNGEDLKKFDKEELEKIVVKKNLLIGKLYKEKNLDSLVKIEHFNKLIYGIANYRTKEEFQGIFDQYKADVFKEKEIQSMEGYQMEFYSEHKIVTLRYSITTPPDPRLKGQPALYYLYKDEYGTLVDFLSIYLFLPKGKPLTVENLQIL